MPSVRLMMLSSDTGVMVRSVSVESADGVPLFVYVNVVLLGTAVTVKVPLYNGSLAPSMIILLPIESPLATTVFNRPTCSHTD